MVLDKDARIYVAGGSTLIGAALLSQLTDDRSGSVIGGIGEPDLTDACAVDEYFAAHAPEYVFLAAGRSGGIAANQRYPAELIRDNLLVECNVIHSAYRHGVRKLVYLASSCSYPRLAAQPILESALLTGPLEPTNEAYAVAKIAGIKLCQAYAREYGANFISAMPTNLYGPNDNFDLETSHVLAALLRKAHEAKTRKDRKLIVWGSGKPRREFLHVDDLAAACLLLLEKYDSSEIINVGCGDDTSIRELAELICEVVGFDGELAWDATKPDGTPRKLLDVTRLRGLGWTPTIPLREGIARTYDWFLKNVTK